MSEALRHHPEAESSREKERLEYERLSELRRLAFLSGVVSFWKDMAARNPAAAKRHHDGFRHQLKYLEDEAGVLRTTETENAFSPAIDELKRLYRAGIDREHPPSPKGMVSVREREEAVWNQVERPETVLEGVRDVLKVLDWQLGLLDRSVEEEDARSLVDRLVRIDDEFPRRAGTVRLTGEALSRMWRRDLPRHEMVPGEREAWRDLFEDYVRLHSYLYVLDRPSAPVDWVKLRQSLEKTRRDLTLARASIDRFESTRRRSASARRVSDEKKKADRPDGR